MAKMKFYDWIAYFLITVGAFNWGLVQWFNFDLVAWLASLTANWVGVVLYSLIGLAGLFAVWTGIKLAIK